MSTSTGWLIGRLIGEPARPLEFRSEVAPPVRGPSPAETQAAAETWQGTGDARRRRLLVVLLILAVVVGAIFLVVPRLAG
jgi:hypothetical protein